MSSSGFRIKRVALPGAIRQCTLRLMRLPPPLLLLLLLEPKPLHCQRREPAAARGSAGKQMATDFIFEVWRR